MTEKIQAHAFVAGELDKPFYGRTDLERYDLGVALAENFFIDYRGGLMSRAGFEFADAVEPNARCIGFRTGTAQNDVVLVLSQNRIRFVSNGSYVVETGKPITAVSGSIVSCAAHGYVNGNFVSIAGASCPSATYRITVLDANSFSIAFPWGTPVPTTYGATGTVSRVVEVLTPYSAAEIPTLRANQKYLTMTLTHINHAPQDLTLNAGTGAWAFGPSPISIYPPVPATLNIAPTSAGSAHIVYAVSAVDPEGNESVAAFALVTNSVNFTATAGSVFLTWTSVAAASFYRVYRSIVSENTNVNFGQPLGLIGETTSPSLVDANIVPDFSISPPTNTNPFASGAVLKIEITASGTGYSNASGVIVAGGSGFRGIPLVIGNVIAGVLVQAGGSGYALGAAVTFTGGTGATGLVTAVSPASGNFPAVSATFQQRQVYAGTPNLPMTLFASRVGVSNNFSPGNDPDEGDSYILTIDAPSVVPIKHLVSLRDGLLVLHEEGIDRVLASTGKAVTAQNNYLENQIRSKIGDPEPALVDNDLMFSLAEGGGIRALAYTVYTESFAPQNISVLSAHLFGQSRAPKRLVWVEEPHRVLWVVREDGRMLSLTYLREQEIRGWAQHWTQGLVHDACSVSEGARSALYITVNRQGRWFLERLAAREFAAAEDAVCADACVRYTGDQRSSFLQIEEAGDDANLYAPGAFTLGDVGRVVRARGGKYEITAVLSGDSATALVLVPATGFIPGTTGINPTTSWTISSVATELQNLWHLEGFEVAVLGDGDVHDSAVVTDGRVSINKEASRFCVGLPFVATAKTLPMSNPQRGTDGRDKRIVGTAVRVNETRGLEVGPDGGVLYEMKDKGDEFLDDPIPLRSDSSAVFIGSRWDTDTSIVFRQAYPLPANILGLVTEIEIADP